ncbi:MAG: polysaccharide biosynthesis protein [Gemmatimonadetes bacterium]|nr:polysaccharide biosynthesis protein [Gemmatimonadota bacterium]
MDTLTLLLHNLSDTTLFPLFQKQLQNRQPLSVTHEEVTRFFMTIPEATQLVLQASLIQEARVGW